MKKYILVAFLMLLSVAGERPSPALAIPVFANGQGGVNCSLCHTAVPNLNSYGRYVLMTNFSRGLNIHLQSLQNKTLPIALEGTANASNPPTASLPHVTSAVEQFLAGGFAGPQVSYFASVPIVSGGYPASSVDQIWGAYNGLSHGNGSLQIGRFPTPIFAPWVSQPLSLSGYGAASLPVGLNTSTLSDNRWGVSYTQLGHLGLISNIAFLDGNGPLEHALRNDGEGSALTASVQYLSPESRWSGGIAALRGTYPLPSGASDPYSRAAALASYSGDRYQAIAMASVGRDNNPNDGASPSTNSHGLSLETTYQLLSWLHVDLRYEHTDDGLGNAMVHYVTAAAVSLRPNLVMTVENVASIGQRPTQKYQLLWAGPWYRNRLPRGAIVQDVRMPNSHISMTPSSPLGDAKAMANGRAIFLSSTDIDGTRMTTAVKSRTYQSCAACHGPNGAGGVQLADGAVSAKLGINAHMRDNMSSMGSMKAKKTPWTIPLFERAISMGIDNDGNQLSPVMPRWRMSPRDSHDVAVYIASQ